MIGRQALVWLMSLLALALIAAGGSGYLPNDAEEGYLPPQSGSAGVIASGSSPSEDSSCTFPFAFPCTL